MTDPPPSPIVDTPNSHGMFMLGTTTLYLCHMPMFNKEDHRYQVTLKAHLDPASTATFLADKAKNPGQAYNLINPDSDLFTLPDVANGTVVTYPAMVYRGYSNDGGGTPGPEIVSNATVTVDRVIRYRALNQDIARPQHLTYVLFGDANGAYLDHYIAQDPDFQHLVALPEAPAWLPLSQLQAGVEVSFIGMGSMPIGCQNPLIDDVYQVMFEGLSNTSNPLRVGAGATVWYSTGNMLNGKDPCDGSGSMSRMTSR
jgi:hypothetical protein